MLIIKHSVEIKASPKAIWNILQDAKNWNTWDYSTDYSFLHGEFKEGTTGIWKAKNGPEMLMTLTKVEPLKTFISEFKVFLARFKSSHILTPISAEKTKLTFQTEVVGPLAFLYVWHTRKTIRNVIVQEMANLQEQIEMNS